MEEEGFEFVDNTTEQSNETTPLLQGNENGDTKKNAPKTNKDLYDLYHGSSTRFPGGNCVFESVLAYMSQEQIQNMINVVENFIGFLQNQKYKNMLTGIRKIFSNTPNSKYADLCAYMRAYVYIFCQAKKEKTRKQNTQQQISPIDKSISELTNGDYITPDHHILSAFRRLTERNILKIYVDSGKELTSAILKNECEEGKNKHISANPNFEEIKAELENLDQPQNISSETITLFLKGAHCTPAVPQNQKGQGAQIDCTKFKMNFHAEQSYPKLKFALSILGLLGCIGGFFFPPLWCLCVPSVIGIMSGCKDMKKVADDNKKAFFAKSIPLQTTEFSLSSNRNYGNRPLKQELLKCEQKAKQQFNTFFQTNQPPENSL